MTVIKLYGYDFEVDIKKDGSYDVLSGDVGVIDLEDLDIAVFESYVDMCARGYWSLEPDCMELAKSFREG